MNFPQGDFQLTRGRKLKGLVNVGQIRFWILPVGARIRHSGLTRVPGAAAGNTRPWIQTKRGVVVIYSWPNQPGQPYLAAFDLGFEPRFWNLTELQKVQYCTTYCPNHQAKQPARVKVDLGGNCPSGSFGGCVPSPAEARPRTRSSCFWRRSQRSEGLELG